MVLLPLNAPEAADSQSGLSLVGGKGLNLARMSLAGLLVPGGFILTTQAYHEFIEANQLETKILEALPRETEGTSGDTAALDTASARIRALFAAGKIPEHIAAALREAYREMAVPPSAALPLAGQPVAVRSSATAEDLPDLSFAGQQDTFLNVRGEVALLRAVVDCWSSLWTARAIGYRMRNHVPHEDAALAVVVQCMVEAQVSGVLFTANPLSGARGEIVINATYGLGEALVSGRVEPDQYIVDARTGAILSRRLGAKALSLHSQAGGGLAEVQASRSDQQALPDAEILQLARLAGQAGRFYDTPQDIEWAWANGRFYLLQSRPVTSLFPLPEKRAPEPLEVFFSFAAVQGIMGPITPLGRNIIQYFFAAAGRLYQFTLTPETQHVILAGGERLWVNLTSLVRNTIGRAVTLGALHFIEPSTRQALLQVIDDPRLAPGRKGVRPRTVLRLLNFGLPAVGNLLLNMAAPDRRRRRLMGIGEDILEQVRVRCATLEGSPHQRLQGIANEFKATVYQFLPNNLRLFVSAVAAGMASLNLLNKLASQLPENDGDGHPGGWSSLVMETTRGLPNNPTTEMDLRLWDVARQIQSDPALRAEFAGSEPHQQAACFLAEQMSPAAQELIDRFLDQYGARGLCEIDIGRPRWREEPAHIFEVLEGYVQIEDRDQAPDVVFARGAQAAESAVERIAQGLREQPHGWIKARVARFAARRVRGMLSFREYPKFFMVRLMDVFRAALLEAGEELVQLGDLERSDDLMYLTIPEIESFAACEAVDWRGLIAQRRAAYRREEQRRQIPRLLLSDGRAFYEGLTDTQGVEEGQYLRGGGVSPGSVEGRVRVVFDPRRADLQPGEVMVCPGTDPSWTPLFLTASALVMEVGGMMTHGAVVAREYGIPAVVGVDRATERLVTGQRVRVDGMTGVIEVLDH